MFASSLRVRGNRVVPPGGDDAVPLWEAVVGREGDAPRPLRAALFELNEGRLAYLFDAIGTLDPRGGRLRSVSG